MTRREKEIILEELAKEFEKAEAIVFASYNGLTVAEFESFRKKAKEKELKVKVIKNTLFKLAANRAGIEIEKPKGDNVFIWGEPITASKVVIEFAKEKEDIFKVKGGIINKEVVDAKTIEAYSKLPGREELLGMLLSVWTAPLRGLVGVLSGVQREFVTVLNAIKEKKEKEN